jgi:serine protease AprX
VRSALGVEKSGGKAIDVGIVDSGVSTVLQRWVVFSESFVDSRPLHDELGHGTGVASAIIAINPLVRIHSVKVFTTGEGDVAHAMEALELLAHRGVKIINASWGSDAYPPVDMLVNELRAQGIAVVCAAGNSGPGPGTIVSPGAASGAITVGSITLEDPAYGVVSSFSARGPTYMGEIKPDLVAFGGGSLECIELADTDGTTTCWRGTSFAAPEIASLLSLVWDGNVETSYQRLVTAAGQPKNNDIGYGLPVLNSGPHQVGAEAESGPNTAMATLAIAALLGLATFAASRAGMGGGGRPSPTR